ncbi:glycosyltransferase family 9 protein [Burkholderia sp. FL-7-2-10-S1-D7]|uniref:glycosyltransferase family 9 protein n=1 Tax=Burkholderia sp. FL-7-2-10-S1-D7 TaxID=1637866 RepID=UPI0012E3C906|nr:hypothetical protein [Burkholderia sp. FL-7-2-10-S1-D7]
MGEVEALANVRISSKLKRVVRRVAPGLADRLKAALVTPPPPLSVDWGAIESELTSAGVEFDRSHAIDAAAVAAVAKQSAVIVMSVAPFDNVAQTVDAIQREGLEFGEFVIVDATAEEPRLVAIRDHVAAWGRRLPMTRFKVVSYERQELRFADAIECGWQATAQPYSWIVGRNNVPIGRCFTYLIKLLLASECSAIAVSHSAGPDGQLRGGSIDPGALRDNVRHAMRTSASFDVRIDQGGSGRISERPLIERLASFCDGIFGGERSALADDTGRLLDGRFISDVAVSDFSLSKHAHDTPLVRTRAAASRSLRGAETDAVAPWEALHDWRWLLDKRAGTAVHDERIELVCPFHRGDVVLAVQVAAHVAETGRRIRLHVAGSLVSWAREFAPMLEIESIPVGVVSAEETYPTLLRSYQYVAQRDDASPRIARCHPTRGLSETGVNLLEYMLEEVGLPRDTRLMNRRPEVSENARRIARDHRATLGENVIFVHPLGGWGLKSIPEHLLTELADEIHAAGFLLVQIGGASDRKMPQCDDAILENYMPSQWREILEHGRALLGVDSWTSHFAAILDIAQIGMYGSTHPKHVNTKKWFVEQRSECLILGPIVNCSPCNSLTCVSYPDRKYCSGYVVDRPALRAFLSQLGAGEAKLAELPSES